MEQEINIIMDWIYLNYGEDAELKLGIWEPGAEPHTFYAVITDTLTGNVIVGESSYGCDTLTEALEYVNAEINVKAAP